MVVSIGTVAGWFATAPGQDMFEPETTALRGRAASPELHAFSSATMSISSQDLRDKLEGFWIGQLVGNFMGLPFEFKYNAHPMPILPDKYYDVWSASASGLAVNRD